MLAFFKGGTIQVVLGGDLQGVVPVASFIRLFVFCKTLLTDQHNGLMLTLEQLLLSLVRKRELTLFQHQFGGGF